VIAIADSANALKGCGRLTLVKQNIQQQSVGDPKPKPTHSGVRTTQLAALFFLAWLNQPWLPTRS
jgi:hypothetical protein